MSLPKSRIPDPRHPHTQRECCTQSTYTFRAFCATASTRCADFCRVLWGKAPTATETCRDSREKAARRIRVSRGIASSTSRRHDEHQSLLEAQQTSGSFTSSFSREKKNDDDDFDDDFDDETTHASGGNTYITTTTPNNTNTTNGVSTKARECT